MTPRQWLYNRLTQRTALTALVPADAIHAGGSLLSSPSQRPFVIYRVGSEDPLLTGDDRAVATGLRADVWVYDEPGSYQGIEAYLEALRSEISADAPTVAGGYNVRWLGNSEELADDTFKASVKVATFQLVRSV